MRYLGGELEAGFAATSVTGYEEVLDYIQAGYHCTYDDIEIIVGYARTENIYNIDNIYDCTNIRDNKLGLSWAKLSSNWD